jgi:hypothetical protein
MGLVHKVGWRGRVIARDPSLSRVRPVLVCGLDACERRESQALCQKIKAGE